MLALKKFFGGRKVKPSDDSNGTIDTDNSDMLTLEENGLNELVFRPQLNNIPITLVRSTGSPINYVAVSPHFSKSLQGTDMMKKKKQARQSEPLDVRRYSATFQVDVPELTQLEEEIHQRDQIIANIRRENESLNNQLERAGSGYTQSQDHAALQEQCKEKDMEIERLRHQLQQSRLQSTNNEPLTNSPSSSCVSSGMHSTTNGGGHAEEILMAADVLRDLQKIEALVQKLDSQVERSSRIADCLAAGKNPSPNDLFGADSFSDSDHESDKGLVPASSASSSPFTPAPKLLKNKINNLCKKAAAIANSWDHFHSTILTCIGKNVFESKYKGTPKKEDVECWN